MWKTIQIIFIVLGFLLIFASDKLANPFFLHAGIGSLGFALVAIGVEAILTRHLIVGRRRHGNRRTYTGIPAVVQGIQFNLIGLFLIGMALMLQFKADGRGFFLRIVEHPGLALVIFGLLVLAQAVSTMIGAREHQDGSIFTLVIWRLVPGLFLAVLGLAILGAGLFEIAAPNAFDEMGGGLLETLYGIR